MDVCCSDCLDPLCPKGRNPAAACISNDFFMGVRRNTNGTYTNEFYNALPASANTLTASHVDALRNYTEQPVLTVLSTGAALLYNAGANMPDGKPWYSSVDGSNSEEVGHLVEVFKRHAEERPKIADHIELLYFKSGLSAGQKLTVDKASGLLHRFEDQSLEAAKPKATSADDFENKKYPIARLYFLITKAFACGPLTMAQSGLTAGRFDKETGAPHVSFEKLKEIKDMNTLHLVWQDFQQAIYVIGKNGGRKAWNPFWKVIHALCLSRGDASYLHELVFESLTYIDLSPEVNVVNFMTQHWTTRLITFEARWQENGTASGTDPPHSPGNTQDGGLQGKLRKHAPVTKQGQWAGTEKTQNGAIAFCNKWNQRKECNRGVAEGPHKGKCMYTHKCRWCMSIHHRGEDKHPAGHADEGEWVCPKHPQ